MRGTKLLAVFFSLILIVIGILIFITSWKDETKTLISQYAGVLVTGFGFFVAVYQLKLSTFKYWEDEKRKKTDFLDLTIETKSMDNIHSIKTQVNNKSGEKKEIDFSFILITKQEKNILAAVNNILEQNGVDFQISCTNDFNNLKDFIIKPLIINNEIGIIPLEFYFSENIAIGNESPGYTYSFDNDEIKLNNGIYSVRFFIYPTTGYHRSTVDSLIIK